VNAVALVLVATARQALLPVCGESLVSRTVRRLLLADTVRRVVVASPPDDHAAVRSELAHFGDPVRVLAVEPRDVAGFSPAEVGRAVTGTDVVLVQDPTRAFTPVSLVDEVVRAVEQGAVAAVPVLPVTDTIKRVDGAGTVRATVDRSLLRVVQGPQAYAAELFVDVYSDFSGEPVGAVTEWIDRIDKPVATVPGHPDARRIETDFDLAVARAIVAADQVMGTDR
jgi:2-C-methyl-D-erythritol 4-phosphate cytidylyltransferase